MSDPIAEPTLADVRGQYGSWGCLIVGAIFTLVSAALLVVVVAAVVQQIRFRSDGITTTATVIARREGITRRSSADRQDSSDAVANRPELRKTFHVTLSWSDEKGHLHAAEVQLPRESSGNGSYRVVYLRSNPDRMILESHLHAPLPDLCVGAMFLVLAPVGIGMLWAGIRGPRRRLRLLRDGELTMGEVLSAQSYGSRGSHLRVRYVVIGPDGTRRQGSTMVLAADHPRGIPAGSSIPVCFDRADPSSFEVDVFRFRR